MDRIQYLFTNIIAQSIEYWTSILPGPGSIPHLPGVNLLTYFGLLLQTVHDYLANISWRLLIVFFYRAFIARHY